MQSDNHFGTAEAKPIYSGFQMKQNIEKSLQDFLERVGQDCYILLLSPRQLPVQLIPPACSFAAPLPASSHCHCQSPWFNSPNHFCCQQLHFGPYLEQNSFVLVCRNKPPKSMFHIRGRPAVLCTSLIVKMKTSSRTS